MNASKRQQSREPAALSLLPVLNVMFLLIPALLLGMEVAGLSAIAVSPPKYAVGPSDPTTPAEPRLDLSVHIMADGYRVTAAGQQHGAAAGRDQDSGAPTIALADPTAPIDDARRYDYPALGEVARELKLSYPHEATVTVSAEGDVPLNVFVSTLDALRGDACRLRDATQNDIPSACLFWQPVVTSRTS